MASKSQAGAQRFAGILEMVETGMLALSGGIELDRFGLLRERLALKERSSIEI
jgi:hypothetical protein